jgi:lysophospholipase L1-like esterase
VNTLNAAHSGNTIHDSLNIFLNRAVSDHPDVAVMMHATNDVGLLAESRDYSTRMAQAVGLGDAIRWVGQVGSSRVYLLGWLRRWLITRPLREVEGTRGAGGYAVVASVAEEYRARLRAFVAICRAFGIEPVLMTEPLATFQTELTPRWADAGAQSVFNDFIRQIGLDEGVLVIDLVRFLEEDVPEWNEPMKLFYDGMHVNDLGSQSYAEHIAARLAAEVLPHVGKKRNVQLELQASAHAPLEKVDASIAIDKSLPAP